MDHETERALAARRLGHKVSLYGLVFTSITGGYLVARLVGGGGAPPQWPGLVGTAVAGLWVVVMARLDRRAAAMTAPDQPSHPRPGVFNRIEALAQKYQATVQLGLLVAAVIALVLAAR